MSSYNHVEIMGRMGRDPELRNQGTTKAVCNFSVATSEKFTKNGQMVQNTEWHSVVVWGKQAENVAKYLKKGSPIFVIGKLATRDWTDREGFQRTTTEIIAKEVIFPPRERPASGETGKTPVSDNALNEIDEFDGIPF